MWEPVGPLPASVYWKRRWLAVVSTIAAIVLVVWTVAAIAAPRTPTDDGTTMRASRAALTAPQQASSSPVEEPTSPSGQAPPDPSAGPASAPPAGTSTPPGASGPEFIVPGAITGVPAPGDPAPGQPAPGQPAPGGPAPGPGTPEATSAGSTTPGAPATTSEELRPDETPRASVPVPPPVPVPATGPVPCANAMLTVGAEIDRPEHRVGQRPVLRLVVTNVSDQPCVRDLDAARQEIVVWSGDGATRLWSSNDCSNTSSIDLRTLVPGQPVAFSVSWAGRTSQPGCPVARTVVPAGSYRVMTRVDDIISAPTPFVLTP